MSESIERKVQPFTIGTRLSVPAVAKCQEFTQSYLQNQSLDNCSLQRNLNSLYLSRAQVCPHGPCLTSVVVQGESPGKHKQDDSAAEDHLNQNIVSPSAVSRSIKKITISGNKDPSGGKVPAGPAEPSVRGCISQNNNNNNNISRTSDPHLPRVEGVSSEDEAGSHFKISLPDPHKTQSDLHLLAEESAAATSQSNCFTQRNSLFHRDVLEAEAWIKSKLWDLKDGGNIQCCPLQDWDRAPQILCTDFKDFENRMVQLNQMGEQLICKLNPRSDTVKQQLTQLAERWQSLKRMAADQTRTRDGGADQTRTRDGGADQTRTRDGGADQTRTRDGGADQTRTRDGVADQTRTRDGVESLQDLNNKVEKLEAWIKEKEEEGSPVKILKENGDKMQLTKRTLDLNRDEQHHRNLQEEINHLALKLEKWEKTDGKNISSRRKHVNKMCLKVQSHLNNYQEDLQQALEVSFFYQQADNTLLAITSMRKNPSASKELGHIGDKEMRDIAGQIMMLDVSVSQLCNLHPALAPSITQKQRELKDSWLHLQKDFRSNRPTSGTFTREPADPLTLTGEAQYVGTETQRIMGNQVREERHLKGCVSTVEWGLGRQLPGNQSQQQQSVGHTSSPLGDGAACADEVIGRLQQTAERKPKLASVSLNHPQLHVQLQKFTASADKTLSWLKDNVYIATKVCSIASCEGLEVARGCQYALEQDILNNKTRIEVVKREGHELVRARHPGSAKIEEFLTQLGGLWEELRRRHQRNAVFLQTSEELGFRVVKVLRALGSLEAWLESVELSVKESAPTGNPEMRSVAEESSLLETEVAARLRELHVLRQEVDHLLGHGHLHMQSLQARTEKLEQKYHSVQSSLTQQKPGQQDAQTLTEFLERVEPEESQEHCRPQGVVQPLNETSSTWPRAAAEPQVERVGNPAEKRREAGESLSHAERGKRLVQKHAEALEELLSKHDGLALRVEACLCRSNELSLDILEKETDMAVRCEPDHCGLEVLQEKQDHQEIAYESMREAIKEMEHQAGRLEEIHPDARPVLEGKVQVLLQGWTELGHTVSQNKLRLQEFVELQDFFRSYLAMISWTEDTRSCIFSDTALHPGKDGQKPLAAELDVQIEQKFEEFEVLVTKGKNLLDKDHHLTQMVKERMEELRSMLGWITVHWRAQKQQWLHKKNREEASQDNIYSTMCPVTETSAPEADSFQQPSLPTPDENKSNPAGNSWLEDGYEIMTSLGPQTSNASNPSVLVVKEAGSPALRGTVNLILNLSKTGDSLAQVPDQPAQAGGFLDQTAEPLHRVSTYLHVKDNNLSVGPVYESITLPRQKSYFSSSGSPTSPLPLGPGPETPNVTFQPLAGNGSSSIFSSLKRMGKKRKRKRDARRHTIQKLMGVEKQTEETSPSASEMGAYDTHTWPLKEGRWRKSSVKGRCGVEAMAFIKNALQTAVAEDCSGEYSITPYAVSEATMVSSTNQVRSHCRFLSLGSVLSFDLPKDRTLIPSIQDIITIAPPESKTVTGKDPDPLSHRHTALSSFKQTRPAPAFMCINSSSNAAVVRDPSDVNKHFQPPPSQALDSGVEHNDCCNDLAKSWYSLQEDVEQVGDKMSAEVQSRADETPQSSQQPIYVNQVQNAAQRKDKCPSVHTLIRDLNGHRYHKSTRPQSGHECQSRSSHVVVNLKSTVSVNVGQDSEISTSSSLNLCPDTADALQPKGLVGQLMSLEVGGINCTRKRDGLLKSSHPSITSTEPDAHPVHLDHQQFEEEEEELEDIWKQTTNLRHSICSDIMYQPSQEEPGPPDQTKEPCPHSPSPQAPAVLYRNQSTASAPNLLVAEFKLPPHVQSLLGYNKEEDSKGDQPSPTVRQRRSWAAFPYREPPSKTSVTANETASDPVKLPEVGDHQRYIYHYREEEEEEEEEEDREGAERAREEVVEHTSYSKQESESIISVNTSLDGDCGRRSSGKLMSLEKQECPLATRGRPLALTGNPEVPSMEGTLERKQKLQLGGKKAASRGWNSYHAIMYRHTLGFYENRNNTLWNSAGGLPLNLSGAQCSPAPDYIKKPNCFRLRLRDGSEYLLSAPSRFLMKKWIMKIHAAGQSQAASSSTPVEQDFPTSLNPPRCFTCGGRARCHCFPQAGPSSAHPKQAGSAHPKGHLTRVDEQSAIDGGCCDGDALNQRMSPSQFGTCEGPPSPDFPVSSGLDSPPSPDFPVSSGLDSPPSPDFPVSSGLAWFGKKQRSHSFTSATFQKIKPASQTSAGRGLERGSNYCVTLVVGDKSSDSPAGSRSSGSPPLASAGWQRDVYQESALRSYTSLPRPRNKSVFQKFFGK